MDVEAGKHMLCQLCFFVVFWGDWAACQSRWVSNMPCTVSLAKLFHTWLGDTIIDGSQMKWVFCLLPEGVSRHFPYSLKTSSNLCNIRFLCHSLPVPFPPMDIIGTLCTCGHTFARHIKSLSKHEIQLETWHIFSINMQWLPSNGYSIMNYSSGDARKNNHQMNFMWHRRIDGHSNVMDFQCTFLQHSFVVCS